MKFSRNIIICAITLIALINFAEAGYKTITLDRVTPKQDWGKGNIFYLDRQNVACPPKSAIDGFHLIRPTGNTLAYKYSCQTQHSAVQGGKTKPGRTRPNATDRNKKRSANYLDRHRVNCGFGFALQQFKLARKGGNDIFYQYTCTSAKCKVRQRTYTKWQAGGKNEVVYLDRQPVQMIVGRVITGFKLETNYRGGTKYRYAVDYCMMKGPAKGKKKAAPKPKPKPAPKPVIPKPAPAPVPKPVRPPKPAGPMPGAGGRGIPPMPRPPKPTRPRIPKPVRPPTPAGPMPGAGGRGIPPMPRPPRPVRPSRPAMPKPSGGPGSLPPMPQPPMPTPGPGPAPANGGDITPAPLNPAQMAANQKGKIFCQTNCVINPAARVKRCLDLGRLIPCRRCTAMPAKAANAALRQTCELVCNAHTVGGAKCDFYGYLNNSKKKHSRALLSKFGLVILRKFFR